MDLDNQKSAEWYFSNIDYLKQEKTPDQLTKVIPNEIIEPLLKIIEQKS